MRELVPQRWTQALSYLFVVTALRIQTMEKIVTMAMISITIVVRIGCNYGEVIIYDPLVPFLPIQTGSLLYSGGTLATEFTNGYQNCTADYFVFANENPSKFSRVWMY